MAEHAAEAEPGQSEVAPDRPGQTDNTDDRSTKMRSPTRAIEHGAGLALDLDIANPFFAVYDLGLSPASHDYLIFILMAEMERRRRFPDHRLHAVIVFGRDRPHLLKPYPDEEQDWRISHVCEPAARMLGAGVTVTRDREMVRRMIDGRPGFPLDYTVDAPVADYQAMRYLRAVKAGEDVPEFRPHPRAEAMVAAAYTFPFVTITIRNSWDGRKNSDEAAWTRLMYGFDGLPFRFVVVPDTTGSMDIGDLPGAVIVCRQAALDPDIRLALYRRAILNMGVSNGPMSWAICGGAPFLKFLGGDSQAEWDDATVQGWGPELKRWPRQYGVFHWKGDSYDVIKPAFEECMQELGARVTATPRPFLDFYGAHRISPVRQNATDSQAHLRRRRALYHLLGITPSAIRGRRVLEFGPGTGQNAIATIQDRPALYRLVDANPASMRATVTNLGGHRQGVDVETVLEPAEAHQSAGDFDLVIAEGLIPFQLDPKAFALHLSRHVAPGGILVVTCIDTIQYMGELTRRMIADTLAPPQMAVRDRLRALLPVFRPHLRTLQAMSRRHEDWILDNLLIPHPGKPFSVADAVDALGGFDVLGCSPRFHGDARWYKALTTEDPGFNQLTVESYRANILNLLDCRVSLPPQDPAHGELLQNMADELFDAAMAQSTGGWPSGIGSPGNRVAILAELVDKYSPVTGRSLWELATFLERPSISAAMSGLPTYSGFFGRGQAYLSLVRRR